MTLSTEQRASRVWASQGLAPVMLQEMHPEEIERLAALVDENGVQVEGFREKFLQIYSDYYDARKASAEEPPPAVTHDKIKVQGENRRSTTEVSLADGSLKPALESEE